MATTPEQPRLTWLGTLVLILFLAACAYGAWSLLQRGHANPTGNPAPNAPPQPSPSAAPAQPASLKTTIGIAYGTEKKLWLANALEEFNKTPASLSIEIKLIPIGSLEGARAIVSGDERIHVWSPASSVYKSVFVQEWQLRHGETSRPILKEEPLALSPMVFVGWKERLDAFLQKYREMNFDTIGAALAEPGGWDAITSKPAWGFFKFGMTDPNKSNSGLLGLVLMGHHFYKKERALQLPDIVNAPFQTWLRNTAANMNTTQPSTGTLMREMVLKGPSTFDASLVYENVAIDYLKQAEGRWGPLSVVYPEINVWNDNPYYILNLPWTTADHEQAAATFLKFLLSQSIQQRALAHGFRPAEASVSLKEPDSPFHQFAPQGLRIDLPKVCEPPKPEAIITLLEGWQRLQSNR